MREILPACADLPQREVPAGETILVEGEDAGIMLVLAEGAVEVVKGEVPVSVVDDPGAFFGEMAVLLGRPHSATVRTVEPSRFFVVTDPASFLQENPEVALMLARLLARRLHAMTTYLADIKHQFAEYGGQLGVIDEVLEALAHDQDEAESVVSDRDPDTTVD